MFFHFSEDAFISEFVPRPHPTNVHEPPLVWAIDADDHAPNYLLPCDCPRICISIESNTTPADRERFFAHTVATRIIVVESRWLPTIRTTQLYRYHLPLTTFRSYNADAGYFASLVAVQPVSVEPVGDLVDALLAANVELRFTPLLWPLHHAVAASTLHFSMIRMRNAT